MQSLLEFLPLLAFFISYKFYGIFTATFVLMGVTAITLPLIWYYTKKLPVMLVVSAGFMIVFGGMTLLFHDETFLKIRPTIVNILFATILLGGVAFNKGILQYALGHALTLKDEAWKPFSLRWGLFFLVLAALNEIVWRHFSTDTWVQFKVFGPLCLTLLFTLSQIPFIQRNQVKQSA